MKPADSSPWDQIDDGEYPDLPVVPGDDDARHMLAALREAWRVRGRTYPNPAVGAVLVREGKVLATGATKPVGGPHAEAEALAAARAAGHDPRGATLYVTLEPCNHHGRTPPCSEAIIAAGIARVVVGARDPNRLAAGGIDRLRAAGIEVVESEFAARARSINEAFHHFHETGKPFVTLKWAMTLDGATSLPGGESRWITGEAARADAHRLRAAHACVAIGIGTLRADNPRLTVRVARSHALRPLRLVVDPRLETPPGAELFAEHPNEVCILGGDSADPALAARAEALAAAGAVIWRAPVGEGGRIGAEEILRVLARERVQSVMVEGGRKLAAAFLAAGAVDQVVAYVAPVLFGGAPAQGLGPVAGWFPGTPETAPRLTGVEFKRLGDDLRISGRIRR